MQILIKTLLKISKTLQGNFEEHPFFKRLKEKQLNQPINIIRASNVTELPYFDMIQIKRVVEEETIQSLELILNSSNQFFLGSLYYPRIAELPFKKQALKFKFLIKTLSNPQIAIQLKNQRLKEVIATGLAYLEFHSSKI